MYVVLCYTTNGIKKYKWIATGIKILKTQLNEYIKKYSYLEDDNPPEDVLLVLYLKNGSLNIREIGSQIKEKFFDIIGSATDEIQENLLKCAKSPFFITGQTAKPSVVLPTNGSVISFSLPLTNALDY